MRLGSLEPKTRAAAAAGLTVIAEFWAALASTWYCETGPQNLLWFLGIPFFVAGAFFRPLGTRVLAASVLLILGLAAVMSAAFFLPAGYR